MKKTRLMCGNSITLIVIFGDIKFINLVVLCFKKGIYQIQFYSKKAIFLRKCLSSLSCWV